MGRVRSAIEVVRSGLGGGPVWALVLSAVVVLAIVAEVAYLVISSGGDDEGAKSAEESLPCNDRAADNAVSADRFAQEVRDVGTVPPLSNVLEIYDAKVVGCADLTGDGIDEMVVQLLERDVEIEEGTDTPFPWAIYVGEDGKWSPALIRTHVPGARVAIDRDVVSETSTGFADGDPVCCPSGAREGEVRWDGERFTYKPATGPRGRTIALAESEAVSLAGFDLQGGSLPAAIELFGAPSAYSSQGEVCPVSWEDLGLEIDFANLGGLDPCGPEGRVGAARVVGLEATQAGWQTQESATVDITENELRSQYPDMTPAEETTFSTDFPEGELFTLVERPSAVGTSGVTPTLSARIANKRVVAFEISVGAAGE
ncbi:MAG: hypothetical protein ACRDMA_11400 [Solirubrobacterales bacterium]